MLERLESRRKELEEAARIQRYKDQKEKERLEKERLEKERQEKERQEKEKATPSTSVQSASSSDCEWEERGTWSKIGIVFGVSKVWHIVIRFESIHVRYITSARLRSVRQPCSWQEVTACAAGE